MFTGLVTAVGRIATVTPLGAGAQHGKRVRVQVAANWLRGVAVGDSIAISGACMTVTALHPDGFDFDISAESLRRTAGLDVVGAAVNLEQSLTLSTPLGGHLVTGHVDGVGRVAAFAPVGESWQLEVDIPLELSRLVAVKGSIVINGVSLTVNQVDDRADACRVRINLIPHTLQHTNLGALQPGAAVNVEVDLIARYVARMLQTPAPAAGGGDV